MNVEYAGGDNLRITVNGIEAAAAGNMVSVTLSREAALRLSDKIAAVSETMRRMAALLKAEKAAGEVT